MSVGVPGIPKRVELWQLVGEIVQLFLPGRAVLRMLLNEARCVAFEDETRGHVITVSREQECHTLYVCIENASLHEVHCDETDASVLTFNYLY